jgi:hypothetical protein
MKTILMMFAGLVLFGVPSVKAQDLPPISTTVQEGTGRFEMVRVSAGTTLRLDKYTGKIHRLTNCPKDDAEGSSLCWKEMWIVEPPKGFSNRPRFQIYSDAASKYIFLFDIETGQAWQYGLDPKDKWHPFIECNDKTSNVCLWKP